MKVTLLGTGTSFGVPVIGCDCEVCRSTDSKDKRFRCAALLETDTTRILIDAGPDIRQQLLPQPFRSIDAVLITHKHYDHVGGLDDLRPFSYIHPLAIYANADTCKSIRRQLPYCFPDQHYPGSPTFELHPVERGAELSIGDIRVDVLEVMHGALPILAFRVGAFAYITDMKSIAPAEEARLRGVKTLVVNALRFNHPHLTHQLTDDAIDFSRRIGAEQTFFIHMTHDIGFHHEANKKLPDGFAFAFDGQQISI